MVVNLTKQSLRITWVKTTQMIRYVSECVFLSKCKLTQCDQNKKISASRCVVLRMQKLRTTPGGYRRLPLFKPGVRIQSCRTYFAYCQGLYPSSNNYIHSRFILLHFLNNNKPFQTKTAQINEMEPLPHTTRVSYHNSII